MSMNNIDTRVGDKVDLKQLRLNGWRQIGKSRHGKTILGKLDGKYAKGMLYDPSSQTITLTFKKPQERG